MKVSVEFQEPDKKKKIKRIIAREGLIIIGLISLGIFLTFIPTISISIINFVHKVFPIKKIFYNPSDFGPLDELVGWGTGKPLYISIPESIGYFLLFFGYPLYLFARFIIWAVRTLREKIC